MRGEQVSAHRPEQPGDCVSVAVIAHDKKVSVDGAETVGRVAVNDLAEHGHSFRSVKRGDPVDFVLDERRGGGATLGLGVCVGRERRWLPDVNECDGVAPLGVVHGPTHCGVRGERTVDPDGDSLRPTGGAHGRRSVRGQADSTWRTCRGS